jgi:hypothetical protein
MKSSELRAQDSPSPILQDMQFVQKDAPAVKVRPYAIEDERGVRYAAELTTTTTSDRAVIDASSQEELSRMIESAARAFALAVRLRQRGSR